MSLFKKPILVKALSTQVFFFGAMFLASQASSHDWGQVQSRVTSEKLLNDLSVEPLNKRGLAHISEVQKHETEEGVFLLVRGSNTRGQEGLVRINVSGVSEAFLVNLFGLLYRFDPSSLTKKPEIFDPAVANQKAFLKLHAISARDR